MDTAIVQFGNDARQQIDFVTFRNGNKHVRMLQISLAQDVETRTIADNPHDVIVRRQRPDKIGIGVDHRHIIIFLDELCDDIPSYFATANNNNLHRKQLS